MTHRLTIDGCDVILDVSRVPDEQNDQRWQF